MRQPASARAGFSLVETLMVLAVMSVLTVMTVSSFSSLRSTSLSSAGNQMVDVFAMARENSISRNAYTLVAIKSQGTGAYSTYCLLELTRQDDGSFGQWTELKPWKSLGQGVMFENGQATDTFIANSSSISLPAQSALPTSFPFQGQTMNMAAPGAIVYECYQPDGTLVGGQSQALRLRLVPASGQASNYYDLVFISNTGVTKIERP